MVRVKGGKMANKQIRYSLYQRRISLLDFISDAKKFKFNSRVLKKYEIQLKEVQAEIQKDKIKMMEKKNE